MIRHKDWSKRRDPLPDRARLLALRLGHQLSPFENDDECGLVAACLHCEQAVGVVTTFDERGIYGSAIVEQCAYICRCYRCVQARLALRALA